MGVAGLWDVLKPAAHIRSLTEIAIKEGFEANPDGKRGFRLGIDASIWFFHAEYGREGENPVLRTLFFRCATLMHTTFLPIFVFDGPKRPDVKRGKKINRTPHKLIPGMKQIVEAFGFEWRMAPGEAEAELAYLNRIGVIDGVLSDDVDNFLFGATKVIRNTSNTLSGNRANPALNSAGKDDGNHTRVFCLEDISNHPDVQLTRGGMILIGLLSGGDYEQGGLARCGVATAHSLAKCGFGDTLYEAARTMDREELAQFLVAWRQGVRHELRTDSQKIIGRKLVTLSKAIPESFPDIDILLSYVDPITSESMGRESNNLKLTWSKEPSVAKLAEVCEFYFEWGYKQAIIKRFRTVIWHSIVLRILRRAALDLDIKSASSRYLPPLTPKKKKPTKEDVIPCGTPSKMIARHFASLGLDSPQKPGAAESDDDDDDERLILHIHSMRTHTSTDGLLEYRLEIAPKQLVNLAESGIKGIRVPEGPDEWASEKDDEEDGAPKKRGKGQPVDPESNLRVWMPACMVRLVEPGLVQQFEDKEEQKRLKKAKKGTRAAPKDKSLVPKEKRPRGTTKKAAAAPLPPLPDLSDGEDDLFVSPVVQRTTQASSSGPSRVVSLLTSDDENVSSDSTLPSPSRLFAEFKAPVAKVVQPLSIHTSKATATTSTIVQDDFFSSPVSMRTGIKDLTKKQNPFSNPASGLKSFYPVVQKLSTPPKKDQGRSLEDIMNTNSMIVPDSEPARAKLRAPLPQDRYIPVDFGLPPTASTSSVHKKAPMPPQSSALTLYNSKLAESDTASLFDDEYNPAIWTKKPLPRKPGETSPSKRSAYRSMSSQSESETSARVHKSPRKYAAQTSPQNTRRPTSPTPAARHPPSKAFSSVIEISDGSDSDALPPFTDVRKLPPLLVARARASKASSSTSSTSTLNSSNRFSKKKPPATYSDNIIDLT